MLKDIIDMIPDEGVTHFSANEHDIECQIDMALEKLTDEYLKKYKKNTRIHGLLQSLQSAYIALSLAGTPWQNILAMFEAVSDLFPEYY